MATKVVCKLSHGSWSIGLLKDLNTLRNAGLMCDVTILLSGGIQTMAHGCVLSAASPFFKTLLSQIEHPEIDMSAFPSDIIIQVLNFIYTGEALFNYSDLNTAHRLTLMFGMNVLDALLQNMLELHKAGSDEADVVTVASVSDVSHPAGPLSPITGVDDLKHMQTDENTDQLVNNTQLKDDIGNLDSHLIQDAEDSVLIQQDIGGMVSAVKPMSQSDIKNNSPTVFQESASKYHELDSVQLQNVLNDIGDIAQMVMKHDDEKNSQKIRRHQPREKPIKVPNKEVPSDECIPDHAVKTLPDELSLNTSTLHPTEKGVFARISFPRSSTFGPYQGEIITDPGVISQIEPRYCWTIYKNCKLLHWLDGHDESKANWMRYVQATTDSEANLRAYQHDGKLFFEVCRRIAATEELLVSSSNMGYHDALYQDGDNTGKLVLAQGNGDSEITSDVTTKDGSEQPVEGVSEASLRKDSMEDNIDYPCKECDIIFLVKDMYHRHMHTVHGEPLPLELYLAASGKGEAAVMSEQENNEEHAKDNDAVVAELEQLDDAAESDTCSNQVKGKLVLKDEDYSPVSINSVSPSESVRRSQRSRKQSKRLQDYHVISDAADVVPQRADVTCTDDSLASSDCSKKMVQPEVKQHTNESKEKSHVCHICQKRFKWKTSLRRHLNLHSSDSDDRIKCRHCGKLFTHVGNLKIHLRIHTGEKPFVCDICGRGFSQNGNRELHMSRHRRENLHVCDICGKAYNDSSYLKKHIRIKHGSSSAIQCSKCGKSLFDRASLRRHMITHTDKMLYKCSICGRSFNQYANLCSHKRIHTNEKKHKCPQCDSCFRTRKEFNIHMASHTGVKRYLCKVCLKSFEYQASYRKHERSGCRIVSQNNDVPPPSDCSQFLCRMCNETVDGIEDFQKHVSSHFYECSTCGKVFSSEIYLNNHQKKHDNFKPFSCSTCGKSYPDEESLKTHRRVHGAKQHACPVCHKSWPTASILRSHMLMHTGEKPHACPSCDMHFRMKHQLKRHMQTHAKRDGLVRTSNQPRPICPTCGKSFSDRQALKKHEFLHTGLKPFACKVCGRSFATRGAMKTHLTGHFGEKRFKCTLCQKSYRANKDYQTHMASHTASQQQQYQCNYCEKTFPYKKSLRFHLKSHIVLSS